MIGKIYSSVTPYYDRVARRNSFKRRPVLVIGGPRNNDYTVLPISTVSRRVNLDDTYDVEIDPSKYPRLNLDHTSYIRTHKQTSVHQGALVREISDLKSEYEELYLDILEKLEMFNQSILDEAI